MPRLSTTAARRTRADTTTKIIADASIPGMQLRIRPNGTRTFMLRYWVRGKEHIIGLGSMPDVKLADARRTAERYRSALADGVDPHTLREQDQAEQERAERERGAQGVTLRDVATDWLDHNCRTWAPATLKRNTSFVTNILGDLLDHPLAEIDEPTLLVHLLGVRRSGRGESASRARVIAGQIFDYAIATRRAVANASKGLVGNRALKAPRRKHYAALPWQKLGAFARALDDAPVTAPVRAALMLAILTWQREGTVRAMRWDDLHDGDWIIPATLMKSRERHVVPLPKAARALIDAQPRDGEYVFASSAAAGHLSPNTLAKACRAAGFEVTAHGFRSTGAGWASDYGFDFATIERQLAHTLDAVQAAYHRGDLIEQRRKMLDAYAAFITREKRRRGS
jgi:integrase